MLSTKSEQEIKAMLKIKSDKFLIEVTEPLAKYETETKFYWSSDQKFLNLAMSISMQTRERERGEGAYIVTKQLTQFQNIGVHGATLYRGQTQTNKNDGCHHVWHMVLNVKA